tara:strand:- start:717 stop:1031 length:315 start_codon:yes stop_codon:yes gene_type:complete
MKKNRFKIFVLICILPFLSYCSGFKDAFEGKKRSEQSDEFLVKKKNPLRMPPDMDKLPVPGQDLEINNQISNEDVKELLKIKDNDNKVSSSGSDLLNNMKEKIK